MNTNLRTEAIFDFEKTMENVRKHKYIRLVTANKRRDYLVSAPNYHKKKDIQKIYWQVKRINKSKDE